MAGFHRRDPGPSGRPLLAVGLLSAAGLGAAALWLVQSGAAAAELAASRATRGVIEEVEAEWRSLLESEAPPAEAEVFTFELDDPEAAEDEREAAATPRPRVAEVLGSAAEKLERRGQPAEALIAWREAILLNGGAPGDPWLRLRALQAAIATGHAPLVFEEWTSLTQALDFEDAVDGGSALVLAFLSAGDALESDARSAFAERLSAAWARGEVALPTAGDRLTAEAGFSEDPASAALRGRVEARLGPEHAARLEEERRRRMGALFRARTSPPEDFTPGRWHLSSQELGVVAQRRAGERGLGLVTSWPRLAAALRERLELPSGFRLTFTGETAPAEDAPSRERSLRVTRTLASGFELQLRHERPERLGAEARRRATLVRIGLGLLGVFTALAGVLGARAIEREHRLGQLKTEFIAGVSHDLRTPLASILLLSENLEQGRVGSDAHPRYFAGIRREAARLRRLVDDVLDFARIEAGEPLQTELEEVDLAELLRRVAEEAAPRLEPRGMRIEVASRDGAAPLLARTDPEVVERSLMNLIENAAKHSGGTLVTLDLCAANEDGHVELAVEDDGRGIPVEQRERVLEPYRRLEGGTGEAGTGLGLSIVASLAESLSGSLSLEAGARGGLRCVLRFPVAGDLHG